jgi:hypothetical protein
MEAMWRKYEARNPKFETNSNDQKGTMLQKSSQVGALDFPNLHFI